MSLHPFEINMFRACLLMLLLVGSTFVDPTYANEPTDDQLADNQLTGFVQKYCIECHGPDLQEADRRFDQLSIEMTGNNQIESWTEILDRLNIGDMPPEDAAQPLSDELRLATVRDLTQRIAAAAQSESTASDAPSLRRLNRTEYRESVRSLLGLQQMIADPTVDFPPDETHDHFRNIGHVLTLNDFLLAQYLSAADQFLGEALHVARANEKQQLIEMKPPFCRWKPYPADPDAPMQWQALRENSTNHPAYLSFDQFSNGFPISGNYRIAVRAMATGRNYPYEESLLNVSKEDPFQLTFVVDPTPASDLDAGFGGGHQIAIFDVVDDQQHWYETTQWVDRGHHLYLGFPNGPHRINGVRRKMMRDYRERFPKFIANYIPTFHPMHPDYDAEKAAPAVEAFLAEQERLRKAGKKYKQSIADTVFSAAGTRQFFAEYEGPRIKIFEVRIESPLEQKPEKPDHWFPSQLESIEQTVALVKEFASSAYRRPTTDAELSPIMQLVKQTFTETESFESALMMGYRTVLCSPGFLYHRRSSGALDEYDLASRLSYFLWSEPPDEQLRSLAESGKISDVDVLEVETERLLRDPRRFQFTAPFLNAWLQLSKLGKMPPSRNEHRRYFNESLEAASREETRRFFDHVLTNDAPVSDFIDADYTFLNARLARLYGIDGIQGNGYRQVSLTDSRRGGLLGHASVLTASANGIDTSPVVRGVWVMECLLGTPPSPPPPDVDPLEPDIRGAKTIREQLAKHREVATCNQCHRRIDPPGFALECFDEIGQFRTQYDRPAGAPIDTSGELATGETFKDVVELKQHLRRRADLVVSNLVRKLLIQATGRIDDPRDNANVRQIVSQCDPQTIGLRTLIHHVVQSETFAR